jgi:hypothetical protein
MSGVQVMMRIVNDTSREPFSRTLGRVSGWELRRGPPRASGTAPERALSTKAVLAYCGSGREGMIPTIRG